MSEAPDGSGRFFIVYQKGKIVIERKITLEYATGFDEHTFVDGEISCARSRGIGENSRGQGRHTVPPLRQQSERPPRCLGHDAQNVLLLRKDLKRQ
jgi:hypothetical protein